MTPPRPPPRRRPPRPRRRGSRRAPAAEAPAPAAEAPAAAEAPRRAPRRPRAQPAAPAGGGKEVVLPELGESVTEGTVTRWLKQVGDEVAVDEPLLEISTDKVDTEIPSPFAGVLQEILVQEDETVAVGAALARIGEAGAAAPRRARRGARRRPRRAAEHRLPPRRRPPRLQRSAPRRPRPLPLRHRRPLLRPPRLRPHRPAAPAAPAGARSAPALASGRRQRHATSRRWCAASPSSRASTSPR